MTAVLGAPGGVISILSNKSANTNGTGNGGENTLDGFTMAGGRGNVLTGGAGNDTYVVGADDIVSETATGGTDTVRSMVANYTLGNHVEHLVLGLPTPQNGTGNALANSIIGNASANVITGAGLNDTLLGGDGVDRFDYNAIADSATATRDTISDFQDFGDTDLIDFTDIIAGSLTFGGNLAAFTANNQVIFSALGPLNVVVSVNLDGNNANAEMQILLTNTTVAQIQAADFLL